MKTLLTRERIAEKTGSRSNLYGFLSLIFRQEPTRELLQHLRQPELMKALSEMGISLEKTFLDGNEEQVLEELILEYTRLFLGPGKHISPHESVHRSDETREGLLWGKSTVEIKQFIEWLGLSYNKDYRGIPDHISVELECMQKLIEREAEAWKNNDEKMAVYCLEKEKWFVQEHISVWVPNFCNQVIEMALLPFYRELAILTKEWLMVEKKHINSVLE